MPAEAGGRQADMSCGHPFIGSPFVIPITKTVAVIGHAWYHIRMEFERLLEIVGDEPAFEMGLLLAGDVDPANVRRQLSRWTKAGHLNSYRPNQQFR